MNTPIEEQDIFTGRCAVMTPKESAAQPFHRIEPHWREDNTCSHCGGLRPSVLLEALRKNDVSVVPTDKAYKLYYEGPHLGGNGSRKCYTNHFSLSQALEFVTMIENNSIRIETPGHFYRGLAFGHYASQIDELVRQIRSNKA